jgi:hypothetical protein
MNNITCLGDFCILVEDCPWFEWCTETVAAMNEDEEDND